MSVKVRWLLICDDSLSMKLYLTRFIIALFGFCGIYTAGFAQSAKQDMKDAGQDSKQAAKNAGKGSAAAAKKGAHKAKTASRKAARKAEGKTGGQI
jgi:hypothetical protein